MTQTKAIISIKEQIENSRCDKKDLKDRSWVFTLNNYTKEDEDAIQSLNYRYVIYGREIAPGTGTPHLQGFIYFDNAITFSSICKKIPRAHIEKCRDVQASIAYCKKEGNFFLMGTLPVKVKEMILSQLSRELIPERPFSSFMRQILQQPLDSQEVFRNISVLRPLIDLQTTRPPSPGSMDQLEQERHDLSLTRTLSFRSIPSPLESGGTVTPSNP